MTTRTGTHRRLLTALATIGVLTLAACGGGDDDEAAGDLIVVEGAADTAADDTATDGGGESGSAADGSGDGAAPEDEEAAAREFSECMRDNGVEDFPDPTVGADGSVSLGVGPAAGDAAPGGGLFDDPDFEAAGEACGDLLEGASFLPGGGDTTELNDQLLEVAQCLRDQGLDVDDPNLDLSGGAPNPGAGNVFGDDFDPDDPAVQEAIEACQGVFTALNPGGN